MADKPERVFDRAREWQALEPFAAGGRAGPAAAGATLGVVSGRRRQSKSFLLQAFARHSPSPRWAALRRATKAAEAESLRLFASALSRYTRETPEVPPAPVRRLGGSALSCR